MTWTDTLHALGALGKEWQSAAPLRGDQIASIMKPHSHFRRGLGKPTVHSRPSQGLPAARDSWKRAAGNITALSQREIRLLCGDPSTVASTAFRGALSRHPDLARKGTWIAGLVGIYVEGWRDFEDVGAFERLLRERVAGYRAVGGGFLGWQLYSDKLFSPEAAAWVAECAITDRVSTVEVIERLRLPSTSKLAARAREELGTQWGRRFQSDERRLTPQSALAALDYCLVSVFGPDPAPSSYYAIDVAISSKWVEEDSFRSRLRDFVLQSPHLGDPRLPAFGPNWVRISEASRSKVLSWLALESVRFFFETILPDERHNRARGAFWLKYYQRIVDFRVALSEVDEARIRARVQTNVPQYSRTDHPTTSAFIMKLRGARDLYVVEFSETGNAAYLFHPPDFQAAIRNYFHRPARGNPFKVRPELKHDSKFDRIIHNGAWQRAAIALLAQHGIRP